MSLAVIQYLTGAGIVGLIGLVLRMDHRAAALNGALVQVLKEFEQHKANDREDFQRIHDRLDPPTVRVVEP